jgi:predicted  nucleic acid-binding Zn-ribbon protein
MTADLSVEFDKYKNNYLQMEKQHKNFDKKLSEGKGARDQLLNEKDQVEREAREEETRLLNLLQELEENFVELESNLRFLSN